MRWFKHLHPSTYTEHTGSGLTVVLPQQLLHWPVLQGGGDWLLRLAWSGLRVWVGQGAWGRIRCCC